MPTGRAYAFFLAALLLYLFGNQTQVGWLYIMSALLAGTVAASFVLNRRSLAGVSGERSINGQPFIEAYEGDSLSIQLGIQTKRSKMQLQLVETCPLASPKNQQSRIFIPLLSSGETIAFNYSIEAHRRGVYEFPPLQMKSRAPFGFFEKNTTQNIPTRALIFPEVRKLKRFDLLDQQLAAEMIYPRSGVGREVIGIRLYRTGDSPRHIHWRSVARTGQLISKEFAEETRPGLSIVLDRYFTDDMTSKYNPFEWGIKCAVSIAEYAYSRNYPVYLAADETDCAVPQGALAWDAVLQYMARVSPISNNTFAEVLKNHQLQSFVAVILPHPEETLIEPLLDLKYRGYNLTVVLLDPQSCPEESKNITFIKSIMHTEHINAVTIKFNQDWVSQIEDTDRSGRAYV